MKIKRYGKEYDYDYMTMYMPGRIHRKLKKFAQNDKLTMVKMLDKILKDYESRIG